MTGEKPNRLIHEKSPYLLQHAHNPVDWYPWGDEALQRARADDKPILLSVGYSSCHWCHVMAHESFENDEIATYMNAHFINIKVDREERPDLDQIYQRAAQLTGVSGGWPLTAFLLPDQRPFFIGTYFPAEQRYGRPGFREVLRAIRQAFHTRREELEEGAGRITAALDQLAAPPEDQAAPGAGLVADAAAELDRHFDRVNGGLGSAPKFPQTTALEILLRAGDEPEGKPYRDGFLFTLQKMARGGIYDQLGGGFHRYSVDAAWTVPHFEKMLYDNGLLVPLYLAAYQKSGDPFYARIARETLDYVLREMTDPAGPFYATQDADSEGEEGRYYVWTPDQVRQVLDAETAGMVLRQYGITEEGNFEDGQTVLQLARTTEEVADERGGETDEVADRLAAARQKLLEIRRQRVAPGRDDKILTGWNGLMIGAMAAGGWVLAEEPYLAAARKAADFLLEHLRDEDGPLLRSYKEGARPIPGYLEDYAYFTDGLLLLAEASLEERYVTEADRLAAQMIEAFWDEEEGGFFFTPDHGEPLINRPRDLYDASTPSAQAVAALVLAKLDTLTEKAAYRETAARLFELYGGAVEQQPYAMAAHVLAWDFFHRGPLEVTLLGKPGDPTLKEWHRRLGQMYVPRRLVHTRPAEKGPQALVCRDFTCSRPLSNWAELAAELVREPE